MPDKTPDTIRKGEEGPGGNAEMNQPWWKPGVVLFGEATGWIVVPIVGALYLGKYLDEKQGTGQLYFLSLTGLAFIISCVGIGMLGVKYIQQMEQSKTKKNTDKNTINDRK